MVRATHIFRRGAIYYWRKRIPIGTLKNRPNTYLQVSLCVSELKAAKHIAVSVNFESERLFDLMKQGLLTKDEATSWLQHHVRERRDKIKQVRLFASADATPRALEENKNGDYLAGVVYQFVASDGVHAVFNEENIEKRKMNFTPSDFQNASALMSQLQEIQFSDEKMRQLRSELKAAIGLTTVKPEKSATCHTF